MQEFFIRLFPRDDKAKLSLSDEIKWVKGDLACPSGNNKEGKTLFLSEPTDSLADVPDCNNKEDLSKNELEGFFYIPKNKDRIYTIFYDPGQSIASVIFLSGLFVPPALCSGIGLCALCKMKFAQAPEANADDLRLLSGKEILAGIRLSCRHKAEKGGLLSLKAKLVEEKVKTPAKLIPQKSAFLAIDFGTTSVHWLAFAKGISETRLIDIIAKGEFKTLNKGLVENAITENKWVHEGLKDNSDKPSPKLKTSLLDKSRDNTIYYGQEVNPQMGAGSEVISRIAYALKAEALASLSQLSKDSIQRVISKCNAQGLKIEKIALAANPTMAAIFMERKLESLARAPYALPARDGEWVQLARDDSNEKKIPLWLSPHISPFVGGDLSAGYAYLKARRAKYPFMLADMGTNGEFLLALSENEALVCSVALGPALEGVGLTFGSEARPGVIKSFRFGPRGLEAEFIGAEAKDLPKNEIEANSEEPGKKYMSGTAYLSLLHRLLNLGALSRQGAFLSQPLFERFEKKYRQELEKKKIPLPKEAYFALPYGMYLSASDVEEILKAKAAFSLAFESLMKKASLEYDDLSKIYIAGSLGEYVDKVALENLGFLPLASQNKIIAVGNSSLYGASLLVRSEKMQEELKKWVLGLEHLDLTKEKGFYEAYADHMFFSYIS